MVWKTTMKRLIYVYFSTIIGVKKVWKTTIDFLKLLKVSDEAIDRLASQKMEKSSL